MAYAARGFIKEDVLGKAINYTEYLGEEANLILGNCMRYINEIKLTNSVLSRNKTKVKKVKGKRKKNIKQKKDFNIQEPTVLHAFESIIGSFKLSFINHLKLGDMKTSDLTEWVYALTYKEAQEHIVQSRLDLCAVAVDHLKHGYDYRVSLETYNWFFKSGFLKRSNNIFKDYYSSSGVKFAYSAEIVALKNKYLSIGDEISKGIDFEDTGIKDSILCSEDELKFHLICTSFHHALLECVKDFPEDLDKRYKSKAKYLVTSIKSFNEMYKNYLNETSDSMEDSSKAYKEAMDNYIYRLQFGEFKEILRLSCKLGDIKFTKENESLFIGYYEDLKGYTKKQLEQELYWLKGELRNC